VLHGKPKGYEIIENKASTKMCLQIHDLYDNDKAWKKNQSNHDEQCPSQCYSFLNDCKQTTHHHLKPEAKSKGTVKGWS